MTEPSPSPRVEVASVTDRGMNEKRPLNEDSMLVVQERGVFAVADGVGGAEAGEVASETAVEVLQQAFTHHQDGDDIEDLMEIAIQRANASIFQMSREHPKFAMMATTIVALHIDGLRATVGHVGDSRLYRLASDGTLHRETDDHSVVEEEVRAGRMTAQQAANHPSRNVISRALGAEQSVEVDMKTFEFEEGTIFLLCSDGITRHIPDGELGALLRNASDLENACAEMKRLCYDRGAEDNLTAIVVRVGGQPARAASSSADAPTQELDDEQTIIRERASYSGAAAGADVLQPAEATTHTGAFLKRPFDIQSPAAAPAADRAGAPYDASTRDVQSTSPSSSSSSPARRQGGGAGRFAGVALLVLAAAALAFYGGLRAERRGMFASTNPAVTPTATPAPSPTVESDEARFDRLRRRVDINPAPEAARMEAETNNQPLNSNDPEFLYLYGRAMLLTNKSREAASAFEQAIERIKQNETARNGQLRIDARLAQVTSNLRADEIDKARAAARALGEEVIRPTLPETQPGAATQAPPAGTANTAPSPVVSPF